MGKENPNTKYFNRIKSLVQGLYILGAMMGIYHILNHVGDFSSIYHAIINVCIGFFLLSVIVAVLYGFAILVEHSKHQSMVLDKIYQEMTKDKESEKSQN